jgi:branched-subunit amino acid transport protein
MIIENSLVICDLESLDLWRQQLRKIMSSRNLPVVQFQLQEFSFGQNQSFSALASSFQKACGCGSGSFLMSFTVVAVVVSYFVSGNRLSNINLRHVLSFVGITVLAALAGKLLGLLWARWRLLRLAASVHNMIVRATRRTVTESI